MSIKKMIDMIETHSQVIEQLQNKIFESSHKPAPTTAICTPTDLLDNIVSNNLQNAADTLNNLTAMEITVRTRSQEAIDKQLVKASETGEQEIIDAEYTETN